MCTLKSVLAKQERLNLYFWALPNDYNKTGTALTSTTNENYDHKPEHKIDTKEVRCNWN